MMHQAGKVRRQDFTIGQLAERSGVKLETIRYYERIGVLAGPPRTLQGRRVYAYEDVRTFTFLRHAREAGFTLAQVRILLKARAGGASCVEVRNMASEHLEAMRLKIAQLVRLSERLQCAMSQCSTEPGGRCPVIEMLDCGPHGDRREYGSSTGLQQLNAAELTEPQPPRISR